jgi:hypothetical protein
VLAGLRCGTGRGPIERNCSLDRCSSCCLSSGRPSSRGCSGEPLRAVSILVGGHRIRDARSALLVVRADHRIEPVEAGPMNVDLFPTPAMVRGVSYVAQCPHCGVLIAVPENGKARSELGACPACSRNERWQSVDVPIGPFKPAGDPQ